MANKRFLAAMIVMILAFGLVVSGCATYATRGGNVTPIGYFTPTLQADAGRKVVASYSIILGLFTIGYKDFVDQTAGKNIDIVDTNFLGIYRGVRAIER